MAKVVVDLTMSLDGFIAGPDDGLEHPLGTRGGERLFAWFEGGPKSDNPLFSPKGRNREVVAETIARAGAIISGRRTYDITHGWGGTFPINDAAVVVLTHKPPTDHPKGRSKFSFVSDIHEAVRIAKEDAGGKDIGMTGASPAQQALAAGLADEVYVHVAPLLLGGGVRLFDHLGKDIALELIGTIETPEAVHLHYRVLR
jgi:dihydrofolate reductase